MFTSIQLVNLVRNCVNYLEHFYHDEEKLQAVSFFISTLVGALIMAFAANYFVPFVGAFNLLIAGTHLYHHNKSQAIASLQSGLISTYSSYLTIEKLAPFLLTRGGSSPVAICCVSLILAIRGAFVVASAVTQNQDRSLKSEAQNSATMLSADPYHFRLNQEKTQPVCLRWLPF
ncbi:hypothetical protein [Legionella tunisiensis]|uniref:hypothetical protein n=1 Tax=Legionella tunisiensis TaxID=1034944 RepID=UPI0002D3072E|nr:hypothetical protein [Legionella tunisiensis]